MELLRTVETELKRGKGFLTFMTLRAFSHAILFIIPLLLAAVLAPAGFGSYALSLMIIYFFTALFVTSSQSPYIVYASEELKKTRAIRKAFTVRLTIMAVASVFFLILATIFHNPLLSFASLTGKQFVFLVLAYFGVTFRFLMESTLLALNKRILNAVYAVLTGVISIAYIGALYLLDQLSLGNIFLMFIVAPVISALFILPKIQLRKLFPLSPDKKFFIEMFSHTKWLILGAASIYLINWGDNLVLRHFVSLEDIGIYNLAYQIFKGVIMTIMLIHTYYLPFIARNINNPAKIREYLHVKRWKIFGLISIGIFVAAFIMPLLISYLYGETYQDAVPVVIVLLVGAFFMLYKVFINPIFHALKRFRFTQLLDVAAVVLNLSLDYLLVARMGIIGAAYATAFTYFFMAALFAYYFHRHCRAELAIDT